MWWIATVANAGSSFAPPAATDIAQRWDNLYEFLVVASVIACVILLGGMVYFALKYKRKTNNDKTAYISHNTFLEFLWSFIPLVIFIGIFAWGWIIYHDMRTAPANAKEVHAYGSMWMWNFEYKNGKKSANEMVVPVNQPIKLIMTSKDVIHSFFVPSFRIKQDVVPGRYTTLWFEATKLGEFHVFCTEYCGQGHSQMLGKIKVVSLADYEAWLAGEGVAAQPPGEKLYLEKGCIGCHSTDGSPKAGPSFKGLFGRETDTEESGKVVADENYIRESILNPTAKTVKGFPKGVMPAFQGQLSEEDLTAIIEFIKNQK